MTLFDVILVVLLAFPRHFSDKAEDSEARRLRLTEIAQAVADASGGRRDVAAALLALGWHESRWAAYVSENRCHEGSPDARCDQGLARSPWQLRRAACPSIWRDGIQRAELTLLAARCAANFLRYGRSTCGSWSGAFAVYAGQRCSWTGGRAREASMPRLP